MRTYAPSSHAATMTMSQPSPLRTSATVVFSGLLSSRIAAATGMAHRAATATRRLACAATEYDRSTAGSSEPLPSEVPTVSACTASAPMPTAKAGPGRVRRDQHGEPSDQVGHRDRPARPDDVGAVQPGRDRVHLAERHHDGGQRHVAAVDARQQGHGSTLVLEQPA